MEKITAGFLERSIVDSPTVLALARDRDEGAINTGLIEFTRVKDLSRRELRSVLPALALLDFACGRGLCRQ